MSAATASATEIERVVGTEAALVLVDRLRAEYGAIFRAARQGGAVAGNARRALEAKTGAPVLSKKNCLGLRGTTPAVEAAQTNMGKATRKGKKT